MYRGFFDSSQDFLSAADVRRERKERIKRPERKPEKKMKKRTRENLKTSFSFLLSSTEMALAGVWMENIERKDVEPLSFC